jgi:serine/threonine protein kinase/dipeptidyl aminopeptidase/acylaminoacyl peptidase
MATTAITAHAKGGRICAAGWGGDYHGRRAGPFVIIRPSFMLSPGSRLGPYEVRSALGRGGMGEVYRAHDARLHRDVALKVLPQSVSRNPDRLRRFELEARAAAALNHPNILAVFDIGNADGTPYIVSELLEGETLREHVSRGPLPVRKALELAAQVARGLAAAHEKGIVHRDLKPENVFVTRDGAAKILDFGLVKLVGSVAESVTDVKRVGVPTVTPTATSPVTAAGLVLGTVGYMSPEQVRGLPADHRSDVFSLGAVLYEMLAGRRPFHGETPADTLTAILSAEPSEAPLFELHVPAPVVRIVARCLEKAVTARFQSAQDLAFALDALSGSNASAAAAPVGVTSPRTPRIAIAMVLGFVAIAAGIVVGRLSAPSPVFPEPTFEPRTFEPQLVFNGRFMPDGRTVVFSAALEGNSPRLFVSRPEGATPLVFGPPATHLLSVSSKGELALLTAAVYITQRLFRGTLARMPIDGAPRAWQENVRDADWSPDGSTLAVVRDLGLADQVEYPLGTVLYRTQGYVSDVRVSPDGRRVAFLDHPARFDNRGSLKIVNGAGDVQTASREFGGTEGVAWTADGSAVMVGVSDSGFQGFAVRAFTSNGETVPRLSLAGAGLFMLDASRDGVRLVTRNDDVASMRARLPGESTEREFPWLGAISHAGASLSRDGRLVLFGDESPSAGPNYAVQVRPTDGSLAVRLGDGQPAAFSPDASRVLATVFSPQPHAVVYPVGPGEAIPLGLGPLELAAGRGWFPDGRRVVVCGNERSRPFRCYSQDLMGGVPQPLTPDNVDVSAISPDGTGLAVVVPGRAPALYDVRERALRPVSGTGPDDVVLAWSKDARSVFVQRRPSLPARVERVDLATGRRTIVSETSLPDRAGLMRLTISDVSKDGQSYVYTYWKRTSRLYVVKDASGSAPQ